MASSSRLMQFINSPTGPKTTHFWGPVANWGFVLAVSVFICIYIFIFIFCIFPTTADAVNGRTEKGSSIRGIHHHVFLLITHPI